MSQNYAKKRRGASRKRASQRYNVSKKLLRVIRKVDADQEFKRLPMLRVVKSFLGNVSLAINPPAALFSCPFQDIPLALAPSEPNKLGRHSAIIYP